MNYINCEELQLHVMQLLNAAITLSKFATNKINRSAEYHVNDMDAALASQMVTDLALNHFGIDERTLR